MTQTFNNHNNNNNSTKKCGVSTGITTSSSSSIYTFYEARRMARGHGFDSMEEFLEYSCPGAYKLPKNPQDVWKTEWKGWDDFLGICFTFEQGKCIVAERFQQQQQDDEEQQQDGEEQQQDDTNINDDNGKKRLQRYPKLSTKEEYINFFQQHQQQKGEQNNQTTDFTFDNDPVSRLPLRPDLSTKRNGKDGMIGLV